MIIDYLLYGQKVVLMKKIRSVGTNYVQFGLRKSSDQLFVF